MREKQKRCGEDWHDQMEYQEYLKNITEISKTCLLPLGHEGKHEWTDDDKWGVKFK